MTLVEFVKMLNEMRFGKLTPGSIDKFKSLSRPLNFDDGIAPTELYVSSSTTIRDADISRSVSRAVKT